ncbi:hypothetical protein MMC26_004666 [Xylographa opegraphella]|nr:hypothetical protein [Xylographa opegraphella]
MVESDLAFKLVSGVPGAKGDHRLIALHQAASRAEEAAERLQEYTVAARPLLSSLSSQAAIGVPWTAPLTPEDSAEENFDILEPEVNHEHPSSMLAANSTSVPRPAAFPSSSLTASGKKRGRPRKLNLIDSIESQGQPRYTESANLTPKERPPGTGKFRIRDQRPSSSPLRVWKPSPANAKESRIFGTGKTVDLNGKHILSQAHMQCMRDDITEFDPKKAAPSVNTQGQTSISLTPDIPPAFSIELQKKTAEENNILKMIFNNEIAPIMHLAMTGFEDRLPRNVLVSVGRAQFADEILNQRLRKAVQNGLQTTTPFFKQIAAGTIHRMLLQKARDHESVSFSSGSRSLDGTAASTSAPITGAEVEIETELLGIHRQSDPRIGVFRKPNISKTEPGCNGLIQKDSTLHATTSSLSVHDSNRRADDSNPNSNTNIRQDTIPKYAPPIAPLPQWSLGSHYSRLGIKDFRFPEPLVKFPTDLPGPSSRISRKQTAQSYEHSFHFQESNLGSRSSTQSGYHSTDSEDNMPRRLVRHADYIEKSHSDSQATFPASANVKMKPSERSRVAVSEISKLRSIIADKDGVDNSVYCVPQRVRNMTSLLSYRQFGFGKWINTAELSGPSINFQLKINLSEGLGCWKSWTGASKDVITAAWAPDGRTYAVGASTELDSHNIQYNRNNNLLLGNIQANTLQELPDHYIDRPTPGMIDGGDNALADTYNAVDPELYTTISHVCFSSDGNRLFSASYDNTVKVWDSKSASKPTCIQTIRHNAHVNLLTLSHQPLNLLASGQSTTENSIRLFDLNFSDHTDHGFAGALPYSTFSSPRASRFNLFPSCLLWGRTPDTSHLLLAGFADEIAGDHCRPQNGDLCLWNAETGQALKIMSGFTAVHDISWHPRLPIFAAASTPGNRHNLTYRSTRSIVRTYQPYEASSYRVEYECPAIDINDVQFHPRDDHYISAGCTDGVTYVWDVRQPDIIMHRLPHGLPIDELDHSMSREEQDTGIRFQAWDQAGQRLLTGSSDGAIKAWNIFVSPEDAFIKDIAHFDAGVMTGTFSPNYDNLLVGLSKGAVQILSVCPTTHEPADDHEHPCSRTPSSPRKAYDTITYVSAPRPVVEEAPSGVSLAAHLLDTSQLVMHPTFGAGQGPNYRGPYARYARRDGANPATEDLNPDVLASQLDPQARRRGRKAGGKADKETVGRYRIAEGLAHERNFMRYAFREGRRAVGKRAADGGEEEGGGKRKRVLDEGFVGGVWWEGEPIEEEYKDDGEG